jgi:hypothetical protein
MWHVWGHKIDEYRVWVEKILKRVHLEDLRIDGTLKNIKMDLKKVG